MKTRSAVRMAGLALTGVVLAGSWQASTVLLRRRKPDPIDPPFNYGIPFENVTFTSRDGIILRGWWLQPANPNGKTLVIVHGHNGSMDGDTAQAARLARAGYRVLIFNLRAHGGSEGGQVTFGAREYMDVLGALDWLQAEHAITAVGLVGFSMGAGVALRTAVVDGRVRTVVADGTICRVADGLIGLGLSRGIPFPMMWLAAKAILLMTSIRAKTLISRADPLRWVDRVRCPVLFIHGTQDPFNTLQGVGRLAALAPHGQLWLVEGGGHRDAYTLDPDAYYERVLGFLAETL